jgi:hypothetical protein
VVEKQAPTDSASAAGETMENREALDTVRQLQDSLEKVQAEYRRAEKSMRQAAIAGAFVHRRENS